MIALILIAALFLLFVILLIIDHWHMPWYINATIVLYVPHPVLKENRLKEKVINVSKGKGFYRGHWCDCYRFTTVHDNIIYHTTHSIDISCNELLRVEIHKYINVASEDDITKQLKDVLGDQLEINYDVKF